MSRLTDHVKDPPPAGDELPSWSQIEAAVTRVTPHVIRTPLHRSRQLDERSDAQVVLKCENFQRVGAFKARGAINAVFALSDNGASKGVACHSSGNHGAALAWAASRRGIPCSVVMPSNAPAAKRAATEEYGAVVIECEPTLAARMTNLAELIDRTGAVEIHPYDNVQVIAGAATCVVELLADHPTPLDVIVAPVGGGGLVSGTALAVAALSPATLIWGAEPIGADDAARSLAAGRLIPQTSPRTIADGLLTSLSPRTFRAINTHVARIATVTEDELVDAMRFVWERMKLVIEPSCAAPVAVALRGDLAGRRCGIIISGGNVDLASLPF